MRVNIGIILIIIAPLGIIYFRNYEGQVISYPALWYAGFIILEIAGWWLVYHSFKRRTATIMNTLNEEIGKLKMNGERIVPDVDRCEFKNGSYQYETEDPYASSVRWMAPASALAAMDTTTTENVIQSYLVYQHEDNERSEKFISHSFPLDPTTLKFYVMKGNIILYVDRFNRKKYYFDLTR